MSHTIVVTALATASLAVVLTIWEIYVRQPLKQLIQLCDRAVRKWTIRALAYLAQLPAITYHAALSEPRFVRNARQS